MKRLQRFTTALASLVSFPASFVSMLTSLASIVTRLVAVRITYEKKLGLSPDSPNPCFLTNLLSTIHYSF